VTLPVIQATSIPRSPLHVLIDSPGLQVYGAGQWLEAKHGAKSRRTWRKLHLAVDAARGMIVALTLTDQDTDDPSQVGPLLDQIDEPIGPPRSTAVPSDELDPPTQRNRHLAMIPNKGDWPGRSRPVTANNR